MFKFLAKATVFAPLLPPIGDFPGQELENVQVEHMSWRDSKKDIEIRFVFPKPIKKGDKISERDLYDFFKYKTEIFTTADTIEEAASKSIFFLEQVLDTASFFSQAACKVLDFISIVNLTQIENIIKKKKRGGSFEKGVFRRQKISETKGFPPGRLVFLTEKGTKKIGRNLFWFRKGLAEFSVLHRFVAFFTALKELDSYFQEENRKNKNFPSSLKKFLNYSLKLPPGSLGKWGKIRSDIIHFTGKKKDYRKLSKVAKKSLPGLYEACYFGIAKFFTDTPPQPSPLIFYEDLEKEVVKATPKIVKQLALIQARRNKGYKEIRLK